MRSSRTPALLYPHHHVYDYNRFPEVGVKPRGVGQSPTCDRMWSHRPLKRITRKT